MIAAWVVDASVGIKLFVQEAGSAEADRLFARLSEDPPARFYVPDLFFVECTNILWKYVQNYGYPADNARADLRALQSLALSPVSTGDLLLTTLDLALEHGIAAYDACYVALAEELDLPLVTADEALAKRFRGHEPNVLSLSEI